MDPSLIITGADFVVIENWGQYLINHALNGELEPGIATAWKMSPDGKEIEFTLRKGVKFHSGDLLTSKDVVFSFERAKTKNRVFRGRLEVVERVEVIDDYHFKILFTQPDMTFIPNRGHICIVSKSYHDRVGEDKFVKEPVGTGPYRVVRYVPGEYFDLERFDDYWGEKPSVKEARFYSVREDTTRVARVKTGEADITVGCPYPLVEDLKKTPGVKVLQLANNHPTVSICFANRNPNVPWHDKRVRLAMAHAIDYDAIIKNVLFGIPNRFAHLAPNEPGYDPNIKPFAYDPKKARELLAEAGYPKGFDFKFYYPITGRLPMVKEQAELIASYFEAVGIRTKVVGLEYAAFLAKKRAANAPDADFVAIHLQVVAGGPCPTYFLILTFTQIGGVGVYYNPEVDKLVFEARATVNDARRAELIKTAVKMIHEDVGFITIFNMAAVYAMRDNIDFKPTKRDIAMVLVKDITVR